VTRDLTSPPPLDRALLASMVETVQDYAILLLDPDGHIVSWNSGAERFKGWRADEIIGRHFSVFYPPEDVAAGKLEMELESAARLGRFEDEGWRVRKDGSRFWANVVITAVRDEAGTLIGYGKVTRDVTERYEAETALRQSEARFRSVTESATDAIMSVDAGGTIVSWNPAAARLYGWPAEEAIGMSVLDVLPERDREQSTRVMTSLAAQTGGEHLSTPVELVALRRDGVEVPVEVSIGSWIVDGEVNYAGIVRDITERKRIEGQLQYLADHDSLTGLFNRRRFEAELERIVSEAGRYGRRAALLVCDLDGFKLINDHHGHSAGDEVITKIGAMLASLVRESDLVARLGGDEFGLVLHEADRADAVVVAEKMIEEARSRGLVVSDLIQAQVTVSVGITLLDGDARASAEELMIEADRAMYDAKAHGRNTYAVHVRDRTARNGLTERQSWLARLRQALDEDRFELYAQPIVPIHSGGIPRYELLLRLRDDNGGLLVPGAFLYNAERFDLIGGIDRWVLQRAVRILHDHHLAGNEISLTVNLSGKTMNDLSIAEDLEAMLAAHPVPPGNLIVEVTETAAIVNINRAGGLARDLRALGCDFALDDFGSGFASFYYLKHLDFDYLKIDGEFIAKLVDTPADQLVVRAVVDIARGLGTRTIAEFVSDDRTVELLREMGVDYGQGYHLGRPAPLGALDLEPIP
jgi:diguanylate cyclase (GGDEF)-like protein/PAS domain S-box-containing protein